MPGLDVVLENPPTVDKDTKFIFFCSSTTVPKGNDHCAFFFWLHTFFIEKDCNENYKDIRQSVEDPKSRRLVQSYWSKGENELKVLLKREVLDNPHKRKTWNVWGEDFSVKVTFEKYPNYPNTQL